MTPTPTTTTTLRDHATEDSMVMQTIVHGVGQLIRRSHASMVVDRPRLIVRGDDERGSMVLLEDSDSDDDWKQIAATLRGENKAQSERIQKLEQDITTLKTSHAALVEAHHALQTQHEATSRELTAAQADAPMVSYSPPVATIPPTGTQGRDALYWYHMCRTLQAQFVESRRELELKTEQFVVALAKKNSSVE